MAGAGGVIGCRLVPQLVERGPRGTEINGLPGVMFVDAGGRLIHVMTIDIADGVVQNVRSIINPDKLRHLGPLADIRAAMRASHRRS